MKNLIVFLALFFTGCTYFPDLDSYTRVEDDMVELVYDLRSGERYRLWASVDLDEPRPDILKSSLAVNRLAYSGFVDFRYRSGKVERRSFNFLSPGGRFDDPMWVLCDFFAIESGPVVITITSDFVDSKVDRRWFLYRVPVR